MKLLVHKEPRAEMWKLLHVYFLCLYFQILKIIAMRNIKNVKFLSEIKKKRALSTKNFRFSYESPFGECVW